MDPLLAQLGFRRRAGDVFTMELTRDVVGWLGLSRASRHLPAGEVEINPIIGVRHQEVERIVADLRGKEFHAYIPPTVSTPLGYVMPGHGYRAWFFRSHDEGKEAAELVEAVSAYGLPFMRRAADLSELCRELDRGLGPRDALAYRRPVAWMLFGNVAHARDVLEETSALLGSRSDLAAEKFRKFNDALRQRLTASREAR